MTRPPFPEPSAEAVDTAELFTRYLDFCRETLIDKVTVLDDEQRRTSVLPSAWTPVELMTHLAFMERRWIVWGFLGEVVDDPWADHRDDAWHADPDRSFEDLVVLVREVGRRTTRTLATKPLGEEAPPGPRFERGEPTLAWVCFHLLQEYARHLGHLDVAVELAGGPTGE